MGAWIASVFGWLVGATSGAVRTLASFVRTALSSLWSHIQSVANLARNRFSSLLRSLNNLSITVGIWTSWVANQVRDLYNRYVPRFVRNAVNDAIRWVQRRLSNLANDVFRLLDSWVTWLRKRIDSARRFASDILSWASRQLSGLRSFVNGLIRNIQHILGGPRRLADWLIGAIVDALWRYVQRNETRIARWARDRSLAATVFVAGRLESLIRRVL